MYKINPDYKQEYTDAERYEFLKSYSAAVISHGDNLYRVECLINALGEMQKAVVVGTEYGTNIKKHLFTGADNAVDSCIRFAIQTGSYIL